MKTKYRHKCVYLQNKYMRLCTLFACCARFNDQLKFWNYFWYTGRIELGKGLFNYPVKWKQENILNHLKSCLRKYNLLMTHLMPTFQHSFILWRQEYQRLFCIVLKTNMLVWIFIKIIKWAHSRKNYLTLNT